MDEPTGPLPPRANPNFFGHAEAVERITAALGGERLHHAWLIGGPRGVGKATLAFRIARRLLAGLPDGGGLFGDAGVDLAMSPDDPVFRRVASGGHGDLLTIERPFLNDQGRETQDLNIAQARRIAPFLHRTAAEDGWRVVLLDDCHRMNNNSANAILKILEEPPARTVLLLVCETPGALPATIRSRCRRLELGPLSDADVRKGVLAAVPDLADADTDLLVSLATGSLGRALDLAAGNALGTYRRLSSLLCELPQPDRVAVATLAEEAAGKQGEALFEMVRSIVEDWLDRLVRVAAAPDRPPVARLPGEADALSRQAGAGLDRWWPVWEKTRGILARGADAHLDRRQVVLAAFGAMAD